MKTNRLLIDAFRRAAIRILNPSDDYQYNWCRSASCNCGILARELIGATEGQVWRLGWDSNDEIGGSGLGTWDRGPWAFRDFHGWCPQTGLPMTTVTKLLSKYGIEKGDMADLEQLYGDPGFSDGPTVAAKFVEIADRLERELSAIAESRIQETCTA